MPNGDAILDDMEVRWPATQSTALLGKALLVLLGLLLGRAASTWIPLPERLTRRPLSSDLCREVAVGDPPGTVCIPFIFDEMLLSDPTYVRLSSRRNIVDLEITQEEARGVSSVEDWILGGFQAQDLGDIPYITSAESFEVDGLPGLKTTWRAHEREEFSFAILDLDNDRVLEFLLSPGASPAGEAPSVPNEYQDKTFEIVESLRL